MHFLNIQFYGHFCKFSLEFLELAGVFGIFCQIPSLIRIFLVIIEFPPFFQDKSEGVFFGAQTIMAGVIPRIVVEGRIRPVLWGLTFEQRPHAAPLHGCGNRHPGVIKKGWGKVDIAAHFVVHLARFDSFGIADKKRHFDGRIKNQSFVIKPVLAKIIPLVRGVNDDRIFRQTFLIKILKNAPNIVIQSGATAQISEHQVLIGGAFTGLRIV